MFPNIRCLTAVYMPHQFFSGQQTSFPFQQRNTNAVIFGTIYGILGRSTWSHESHKMVYGSCTNSLMGRIWKPTSTVPFLFQFLCVIITAQVFMTKFAKKVIEISKNGAVYVHIPDITDNMSVCFSLPIYSPKSFCLPYRCRWGTNGCKILFTP